MKKILLFLKKEIVLCLALILGCFGVLICRPSFEIIKEAVDFRVLALLFCLMYVIQGFSAVNILDKLANKKRHRSCKIKTCDAFYIVQTTLFNCTENCPNYFDILSNHFGHFQCHWMPETL